MKTSHAAGIAGGTVAATCSWCSVAFSLVSRSSTRPFSIRSTAARTFTRHGQQYSGIRPGQSLAVMANPARRSASAHRQSRPPIQHRPQRKSWFRCLDRTGMRSWLARLIAATALVAMARGTLVSSGQRIFVLDRGTQPRPSHAPSFFSSMQRWPRLRRMLQMLLGIRNPGLLRCWSPRT